MKLQSKDGNMVVDFYPIKTPMGNVSEEWFLKTLTFMGQSQSKKFLNRIEMNLEIEDELSDLISDQTGWCVNSLDYLVISESH